MEPGDPAVVTKPNDLSPTGGTAALWGQRSIRPVAAAMLVVVLFARAVAPSLRGIAVGYDAFTNRASFVADAATVALLLVLLTLAFVQSMALAASRVPLLLRIPALLLGGLAVLVALAAPSVPRPPFPLLCVASATASALALLTGGSLVRQRSTSMIGVAAILAALATMVRLAAVFFADLAASQPRHEGPDVARVLATGAFALEALLLVVGGLWLALRNRRLALPMVLAAVGLAVLATRSVDLDTSNTHVFAVLLRFGARQLLTRPVPLVPYYAEVFLVVLGPLLALVALLLRAEVGTWVGTLSVVLLVRSAAEIPLYTAALAVACTAMLLAAHDPRALWAALKSK